MFSVAPPLINGSDAQVRRKIKNILPRNNFEIVQ